VTVIIVNIAEESLFPFCINTVVVSWVFLTWPIFCSLQSQLPKMA